MKATNAQIQQRVEEVLRIRLDGAEFWDIREYAREKEKEEGSAWELPENGKPLSDAQLWRYVARADKLVAESCRSSRKKLLRRHLAQRRNMYAKAIGAGDVRTALAVARDECELLNLYPPKKTELTGKDGGPLQLESVVMTNEERLKALAALHTAVGEIGGNADTGGTADAARPALGQSGVGDGTSGDDAGPLAAEVSPLFEPPDPVAGQPAVRQVVGQCRFGPIDGATAVPGLDSPFEPDAAPKW